MRGLYLIGNYPDRETFVRALGMIEDYGFDFVEVGVPFSDPVADGPFLAKRAQIAIERGVTFRSIIDTFREHRFNLKTYIMTYSNIVLANDPAWLNDVLAEVGFDGLIIADLPNRMHWFFRNLGITLPIVHFATPESRYEELEGLKSVDSGFIYYVSVRGITGARLELDGETKEKLLYLKGKTRVPVILGFGIRDRTTAEIALNYADGFVVGTEAVRRLEEGLDSFRELLKELVDIKK